MNYTNAQMEPMKVRIIGSNNAPVQRVPKINLGVTKCTDKLELSTSLNVVYM